MLNKEAKLSTKIFLKTAEPKETRQGIGDALLEKGRTNDRIVVLSADLKNSTRVNEFEEAFPERFIEVGVSEQALATVASGMASYGKIPFITSFSIFSPGRNWEQIRTTICLNDVAVKIIGSHAGLSAAFDGATHQALEDIAITRVLPNMTVLIPCDYEEAKKCVFEAVKISKPCYIRVQREATPEITTQKTPFKIGKAELFWNSRSPQVLIISAGPIIHKALLAAKELDKKGIEVLVLNSPSVKPLDERTILKYAKACGAVITLEEHQAVGGLGSAVADLVSQNYPMPIEILGVKDAYGESGKYEDLLKKHNLTKEAVIDAVKRIILRKNY